MFSLKWQVITRHFMVKWMFWIKLQRHIKQASLFLLQEKLMTHHVDVLRYRLIYSNMELKPNTTLIDGSQADQHLFKQIHRSTSIGIQMNSFQEFHLTTQVSNGQDISNLYTLSYIHFTLNQMMDSILRWMIKYLSICLLM